ncbi:MAG: trypsin-like peptidase domain-containing protein [Treponema sp.]|jgi:S1-C subfamily serine protease|nr:trypsin-like peptidase domain-containing protein [Treponema sp.]
MMKRLFGFFFPVIFAGLLGSCLSIETQEKRLAVYRSAEELRLGDIRRYAGEDPARAIHLIGMYRLVYGIDDPGDAANPSGDAGVLAALEAEAVENLKKEQARAIGESRWDDAASLARSLAALGLTVENTGREPDFILANAKQLLTVNDLASFLEAVQVHKIRPLSFEDALLFLERAVLVKQRRTAAFFLAAARQALEADPVGQAGGVIPAELAAFAQGQDTPQDMIKGVATVLVDRGLRVERGRGFPDRVLGSAFFVDVAGFLITNYHVISSEVDPSYEGYSRMYIRLGDSSSARIPAKVVGWDKAMDLALIKVEYKPAYVFSVVDRVIPQVGDSVLAIGSPGGLEKTVTMGIVSALSRRFLQIGDVIQIDAAVNHGNSGGPVVDTSGRLVGIAFAGIEQYQGLNFAVPAERLAAALPAMIKGGKAERPWLGLTVAETSQGAEIIYAAPLTPAADLQIAEGSIIRTINGERISASQGLLIPALQDTFFSARPGELVALETSAPGAGTSRRVIIRTVARPDVPLVEAAKLDSRERMAAPLFGLILAPTVGKSFSPSYLVKRVVRGSIADEAGLSEQDPVSIRGFRVLEKDGYALMEINVKKRRMGYLETTMQLPALLDSPDTL